MPVSNEEIAELFENMATLLEMKGDTVFKIRAYQRAARTIGHLSFSLEQAVRDEVDLKKIPGIGKAISEKTQEYLDTGRVRAYDELVGELPDGVLTLMTIPGIGPKSAMLITQELGISTIEGIEKSIHDGALAALPRMGRRTADNILRHIQSMRTKDGRTPIGSALAVAEDTVAALRAECPYIEQLYPAGSLRRWEETIGDIDLVGVAPEELQAGAGDVLAALPAVQEVLVHGPKKTSVILEEGIQVDLRLGESGSFGAMLQYFSGSQQHNIRLRDYANRRGYSLNEYGITSLSSGEVSSFADEESFYAFLGLPYIAPELRIGFNELEAAQVKALPNLVTVDDLKGDLHLHSEWSDGRDPIERMVEAAVKQGYQYMALTDHSSGRGVANGLSNDRLVEQIGILRDLQSSYPITILCGSEVDIRADGTLDYPDELLAELDVVVASVHSAMGQDSDTMTQRIIRAMEHPSVTIIGHASTRLLSRRQPVQFDIEALLRAARETGTAMEVNSAPERLDLKDTHAHRARELSVPLAINTDSHHYTSLGQRRFGVAVARRAWCESRHILNTLPLDRFLAYIRTPKPHRLEVFDSRTDVPPATSIPPSPLVAP
ncbi:MAG: DNA polymerase/3'-5' exonuclease PolX [Chloroflexi bacterium]|nr:DNA polymerase/3'-5' exonuclease PolX [Chloroflexota bacterium]